MRSLLSATAIALGAVLIYMGYTRHHSVAGSFDASIARVGRSIDGRVHIPDYAYYYAAGSLLVLGGVIGLGLVKE